MSKRPLNKYRYNVITARRLCELVVFVFTISICGYLFISFTTKQEVVENKQLETLPAPTATPLVEVNPNADFTDFKHTNPQHERLPCLLCHKREDNSPTPKFAVHQTCSGCHTQQFADKKSAICTICHTNAESGEMKRFPTLQSHNASFDHAQHLNQTNCATCHKPINNGVALSIPSRSNSHGICFQCHTPEAKSGEKNIGSCETCHQNGNPPRAITVNAKAYSTPFSHSKHNMNCSSCHTVKAGASRGNQVTAIVASMHFPPKNAQSCATCHNNQKAFGGTDFADCKRCHTGSNFKF